MLSPAIAHTPRLAGDLIELAGPPNQLVPKDLQRQTPPENQQQPTRSFNTIVRATPLVPGAFFY